jgi:hypothetical protein
MTRREPPSAAELHRRYRSVRPKLEEYLGNMPSSEGGGGKGGHSDRTATIALAPDAARLDLQWLDLHVGRLTITSSITARIRIDDTLRRWELTEAQADGLRVKADDSGDGWCKSHWRVHSLAPPRSPGSDLCDWCYRWTVRINDAGHPATMPPREFVDAHSRGVPARSLGRLLPPGVIDG